MIGPGVAHHPRYRDVLIETAVVTNAAFAALTLQREIGNGAADGVRVTYGVYELSTRTIWAPRCGSQEVMGLAAAPVEGKDLAEFGRAVVRSQRIGALLAR